MGLLIDKKLPLPHSEFDNEGVRYRHRFTAFNSIRTPSPVHYLQYKSIADLSFIQPAVNLYVASARNFHQAKQFLEMVPPSCPQDKEVSSIHVYLTTLLRTRTNELYFIPGTGLAQSCQNEFRSCEAPCKRTYQRI